MMSRLGIVAVMAAAMSWGQGGAVRTGFTSAAGQQLGRGDDVVSSPAVFGFAVNFFGTTVRQVWISNNGYVAFEQPPQGFTPASMENYPRPVLAPFLSDVDTTTGTGLVSWGQGMVNGRGALAVTWSDVGYSLAKSDKKNRFQLVVIDRTDTGAGNFDFEFNYDGVQWETGDRNGGVAGLCPATCMAAPRAGYSNGMTGANARWYEVPGSGVRGAFLDGSPTALRLRQFGGSGVNGRLAFQSRGGVVQTGPVLTDLVPSSATAGIDELEIRVVGSGFTSSSVATWAAGGRLQNLEIVEPRAGTELKVKVTAAMLAAVGTAQVNVVDGAATSAARTFTIVAPTVSAINFRLRAAVTSPTEQPTLALSLGSAATQAVTGVLTLSFVPNGGNLPVRYIDPAVRFASGVPPDGTRLNFTIPLGATDAVLPGNGVFSQGTVAGTITVSLTSLLVGNLSVLPSAPPSAAVTVGRLAPLITAGSARYLNVGATGFSLELQGFSTMRELTNAVVTFSAGAGGTLDGTTTFTVPLAAGAASWFDSAAGQGNGSRFRLQLPFTYGGDLSALGSASIVLGNGVGTSTPAVASR